MHVAAVGLGAIAAMVPLLALIGLGVHRHGAPVTVAAAAVVWVLGPPLAVVTAAPLERRAASLAAALWVWSAVVFVTLPVYFPGERTAAVTTGLALFGFGADLGDLPQRVAATLPEEPALTTPELAVATAVDAPVLAPAAPLPEDALALPYEGDGRRMTVPVVFGHEGAEIERQMLFDTGATYTTLTEAALAALGLRIPADAPVIRMQTANGERSAQLVRIDEVWLGSLLIPNVVIAVCEACAASDHAGLLGLNVSGGFNLQIDADRREVVFAPRQRFDRVLDVKPFTELDANFTRFPGGRVEIEARLTNPNPVPVLSAAAEITCGSGSWLVRFDEVAPGTVHTERQRLPAHPRCERYELQLRDAVW